MTNNFDNEFKNLGDLEILNSNLIYDSNYINLYPLNMLNFICPYYPKEYKSDIEEYLGKKTYRSRDIILEEETKSEYVYQTIKKVFSTKAENEDDEKDEKILLVSNSKIDKKNLFEIKKAKTPGRKPENKEGEEEKSKKMHKKNAFDNIITKVQVHYIKFIINLANDIIEQELKMDRESCFKDIQYKIKRKINFNDFEILKTRKIENVILKPISSKFQNFNLNNNKEVYNKVINRSELLKKFFNFNYLKLFKIYYNNREKLNKITINEKEINLSEKTESFSSIIQKNKEIEEEIIESIKRAYFGGYEKLENNNLKCNFVTKNN